MEIVSSIRVGLSGSEGGQIAQEERLKIMKTVVEHFSYIYFIKIWSNNATIKLNKNQNFEKRYSFQG